MVTVLKLQDVVAVLYSSFAVTHSKVMGLHN